MKDYPEGIIADEGGFGTLLISFQLFSSKMSKIILIKESMSKIQVVLGQGYRKLKKLKIIFERFFNDSPLKLIFFKNFRKSFPCIVSQPKTVN